MPRGRPWTDGDNAQLRRLVEQGRPTSYIAKTLDRSEGAITIKIWELKLKPKTKASPRRKRNKRNLAEEQPADEAEVSGEPLSKKRKRGPGRPPKQPNTSDKNKKSAAKPKQSIKKKRAFGSKKKWTFEDRGQLCSLFKQGETNASIAEKMGRSESAIYQRMCLMRLQKTDVSAAKAKPTAKQKPSVEAGGPYCVDDCLIRRQDDGLLDMVQCGVDEQGGDTGLYCSQWFHHECLRVRFGITEKQIQVAIRDPEQFPKLFCPNCSRSSHSKTFKKKNQCSAVTAKRTKKRKGVRGSKAGRASLSLPNSAERNPHGVSAWSVEQVGDWIASTEPFASHCPALRESFAEQEVDGSSLQLVGMTDLYESFDVKSFKDRKKMLEEIRELHAN